MNNKIISYIGFCIKKGSIVFGLDKLEGARGVRLVLIDSDAGKNTRKQALRLCKNCEYPVFEAVKSPLSDYCGRNSKVIGITDKELAGAIIKVIQTDGEREFVQPNDKIQDRTV